MGNGADKSISLSSIPGIVSRLDTIEFLLKKLLSQSDYQLPSDSELRAEAFREYLQGNKVPLNDLHKRGLV
jgi:hypothetical protein